MTNPDEPWVVTCTVTYNDKDHWEDERGNIEWIDVSVNSTFEVYRGRRIECERYAASFKEVKVHEGKLVRSSSLTIGKACHWDEFIEDMSGD
jgi:hypothetical protein